MKQLKITTTASSVVTLDGLDVNEVIRKAADLAHEVLEEQNPADKVEPKFKVGDWVVFNNHHDSVYQVEKIENYKYILRHILGGSMPLPFSHEDMIRVWTIEDVKDGDVLAIGDVICIFKKMDTAGLSVFWTHCAIIGNSELGLGFSFSSNTIIHPATKEQRDKLLKVMADAGYTFNFKEKELKNVEQKHAWNKENENRIKDIIYFLDTAKKHYASTVELDACIDWLKSLRPQNKYTYNPYKEVVESIAEMCKRYDKVTDLQDFYNNVNVKCKDAKEYDSLFPQNTWKPSDEQMQALSDAGNSFRPFEEGHKILWSLYNDLKKLREE